MLDFVAEHPWACLLFLIVLCVGVEYLVNRDDWKKRSAEVTITFVGVFAAIVFALAQGKYDREEEGRDKAITLFKAAEVELKAIMEENKIAPSEAISATTDDVALAIINDDVALVIIEPILGPLTNLLLEIETENDGKNQSKTPIFEALMKEPEVLSRFPDHIIYMLSNKYRLYSSSIEKRILFVDISNYFSRRFREESFQMKRSIIDIYPDKLPKKYQKKYENLYSSADQECLLVASDGQKEDHLYRQCMLSIKKSIFQLIGDRIWKEFADTQYVLCALRTSLEIERPFKYEDDDLNLWMEILKSACGKAVGLPPMGPYKIPYIEYLLDVLKHGSIGPLITR